jgi:hypothetical protein
LGKTQKQTTMKTSNLEKLKNDIKYLNEEQAEFIGKMINTFAKGMVSKRDILELAHEDNSSIDTAIPLNYGRSIKEIHPNFNTMFHVYSYQENTFGEMENIAESVLLKLSKLFK